MLLAVDLGKTWCRAVLRDAAAGTEARPVAVAGAPGLAAPGGVRAAERAVLTAAAELGLDGVDEAVVGAAGALAAPGAARELGEALLRSLPARLVTVTSDAVLAHAGALGGAPGVVLIAGTGVVALAIGAGGELRTVDGWGPWLGDEGGGAWIGASGLRAALRAYDGRGPSTTLLETARARFGDPSGWPTFAGDARALASFAPDVLAARGDAAAMAIVGVAAEMLATAARAAGEGPVAFAGGLAAVEELREQLELVPSRGDALDGALRLGAIHEPHLVRVAAGDAPATGDPIAADVDGLATERVRPDLGDLDARPVADVVGLLVAAQAEAHAAVAAALPEIAAAAEAIAERLERGGRLVYAGAGTAGRLGVLDAAECGPTFGTDAVRAVIAGGPAAVTEAVEGAEDAFDPADLAWLTAADAVVAISASGRTPYVLGALAHARARGRAHRRGRQQPAQSRVGGHRDRAPDRAGGARRLDAPDRRDRAEDRAQRALDGGDDPARQGLRRADGRRQGDEREAAPPRRADRARRRRCRRGHRGRRPGRGRRPRQDGDRRAAGRRRRG